MRDGLPTLTDHRHQQTVFPPTHGQLFGSNISLSTPASTDPQSLIKFHECEFAAIQDDVAQPRQRFANLEHHQIRIERVLIRFHATLAPIRRLPLEILSEIFEECLDEHEQHMRSQFAIAARNREVPLLLGRVCRAWRAVTHATPRLWRDVLVNVCDGRYSDELRKDALPVLQTWLAYSGSLPLNLLLLCKTERLLPGLVNLFETIAAHGPRWRKVHVRLQSAPVIYKLVSRAFSRCTALSTFHATDGGQSLSFYSAQQLEQMEDVIHPIHFNLSAAPLRQLSISLAGLTIQDVHAPWSTLTHLSIMQDAHSSTSSITDYVAVLRQCASLKECGISIDRGIREAPPELFSLPSLESLQVYVGKEAAHTTQMGDFLSALDAPRLSTIVIEDGCPRAQVTLYHSQLRSFLKAHAKSLRHFKFATNSKLFTSQDLVAWLVETPSLIELEYYPDEVSSPRKLLEALTPHVQGNAVKCLLPCLERFLVYWDTRETVSMVGDMIEKRYSMVERKIARLKYLSCKPARISVAYDCMPVENLAARLEPLSRYGLQIDWEAYRYDAEFLCC